MTAYLGNIKVIPYLGDEKVNIINPNSEQTDVTSFSIYPELFAPEIEKYIQQTNSSS